MTKSIFTLTISKTEFEDLENKYSCKAKQLANRWSSQIKTNEGVINFYTNNKNESIKVDVNGKNAIILFEEIKNHLHKYKCFVAMEYNEANNQLFSSMSSYLFNEKRILLVRIDEEVYLGNKNNQLTNDMDQCNFAIVNITDNNINVFYELGYLIAKKGESNVIIIDSESVHNSHNCNINSSESNNCCKFKNTRFNIRQLSRINYTSNEIELLTNIYKYVKKILENHIT